jgi:GH15 family glucan-1,4-alpha-glucosidase
MADFGDLVRDDQMTFGIDSRLHAFWRQWSDQCAPAGPWTDAVKRSLVVLKG